MSVFLRRARRAPQVCLLVSVLATLISCGSTSDSVGPAGSAGPRSTIGTSASGCPASMVSIVVTVDQWGDLVRGLAGECATVTTIVSGTAGDPHDYEPTPGDNAKFGGSRLVVLNGVGYDTWGEKAVRALSVKPEMLNVGLEVGAREGDNPHLWYNPAYLTKTLEALTAKLKRLSPGASAYFDAQAQAWRASLEPYEAAVVGAKAKTAGKTMAATESVFDEMAKAIGLTDATPPGYAQTAANQSEPAPGDVNDFRNALRDRKIDVLVFNAQTQGAVGDQLRSVAEQVGVPVVEVTETMPPGQPGFVAWQVDQLLRLTQALG